MKPAVEALFARYAQIARQALVEDVDTAALAALYASDVIAASPAGVRAGHNDAEFWQALAGMYAHYRAIGTRDMQIRHIRLSAIDDLHCVAHVAWLAIYARDGQPDLQIEFDVHYLVQVLAGTARVFGWITGDEGEVLRQHGIG